MRISEIPTPAVLVERSTLERNLDRMQRAATDRGLRLRPHAKTHKSPAVARLQLDRGAVGICCAKLGEAEVFADAGVSDIRLPYPLHPINAPRVVALASRIALSFIVDDVEIAREWSKAAGRAGTVLDVLVKVDVGFHRCGVDAGSESAVASVREVAELPNLRFLGLLSHAGHAYGATSEAQLTGIAAAEVETLHALADRAEVACEEFSVGATPTARFSIGLQGITEIRPGNYAYFDRTQVALGAASLDDCALTVLSRVVSRCNPDRLIFDSGSKALTTDGARGFSPSPGYGVVLESIDGRRPDPALLIERLSEEHATVRVTSGPLRLRTGDLVRIVPNHSCVVSNLVDDVWLVDGEHVVDRLRVAARGRIT